MKVSLITVCFNSARFVGHAMESVRTQRMDGHELEYIVVDGASTDGTVEIVKEFAAALANPQTSKPAGFSFKWTSEPDKGMYDAINKGIKMSTGDVVGILNADDVLASPDTLAHIASAFEPGVDAIYADIRFVRGGDSVDGLRSAKTVRYCSAARWRPWMFRFAAMVPHPSFYARREWFDKLGGYSLAYRICADFELELRYLWLAKLRAKYLRECVVVMRTGGMSTASVHANIEINREDLRALRANGVWSCLPLVYLKYLFKIWGFVFRRRTAR